MKIKAFTLAEVLITLVIIGVIAALTIPTLIRANKRTETEAQLKQTYSLFANAIKLSEVENGEFDTWDFNMNGSDFVKKYIDSYLKFSKVCTAEEPCEQYTWYNTTGAATQFKPGDRSPNIYGGYLANGAYFVIQINPPSDPGMAQFGNIMYFVDINGQKGPNTVAKDVFWFEAYPGGKLVSIGIHPYEAGWGVDYSTKCKGGDASYDNGGLVCTAWIMSNGWKIPDDYPWL